MFSYRVVKVMPYISKITIAEGLTMEEAKQVSRDQPLPMLSGDRDAQEEIRIEGEGHV